MAAVLAAHGDAGRPLWISEVGWPTHLGYGVSERKQAEYLVRTITASAAQGIRVATWYTYGDSSDPTRVNQEAAFGLVRADGTPKPSYVALKTFTSVLAGTTSAAGRSDVRAADHAVVFVGAGRRVTVLWNSPEGAVTDQGVEPATQAMTTALVPVTGDERVIEISMAGVPVAVEVRNGTARIAASTSPVYLVETTPATGSGTGVLGGAGLPLPRTASATHGAGVVPLLALGLAVARGRRRPSKPRGSAASAFGQYPVSRSLPMRSD